MSSLCSQNFERLFNNPIRNAFKYFDEVFDKYLNE